MSLTRGFMYAGARRVVVSLWDVNDKSTASLMSELYRGLLTQKLRPIGGSTCGAVETVPQPPMERAVLLGGVCATRRTALTRTASCHCITPSCFSKSN
jgi:Uncharacterized protein conserved in bacteria